MHGTQANGPCTGICPIQLHNRERKVTPFSENRRDATNLPQGHLGPAFPALDRRRHSPTLVSMKKLLFVLLLGSLLAGCGEEPGGDGPKGYS